MDAEMSGTWWQHVAAGRLDGKVRPDSEFGLTFREALSDGALRMYGGAVTGMSAVAADLTFADVACALGWLDATRLRSRAVLAAAVTSLTGPCHLRVTFGLPAGERP
jgi:hypothetical protein